MGHKQHVDLHRKLALRKRLLGLAVDGPAYVPFIGDGDIANELYHGRRIFGADIDPRRVEVARGRFPGEKVIVADCNLWPFPGEEAEFAVADFAAYSAPYRAFRAFWAEARKARRVVCFFTDGQRQAIKRTGRASLPDGTKTDDLSLTERRCLYNFYRERVVLPWFREHVAPWKVYTDIGYLRPTMLYWGAVLDAPGRAEKEEDA